MPSSPTTSCAPSCRVGASCRSVRVLRARCSSHGVHPPTRTRGHRPALSTTSRRGWADSYGEREPGVASVSAPDFRSGGSPARGDLGLGSGEPHRAAPSEVLRAGRHAGGSGGGVGTRWLNARARITHDASATAPSTTSATAVDRSVTVRWTISATAPIRPTIRSRDRPIRHEFPHQQDTDRSRQGQPQREIRWRLSKHIDVDEQRPADDGDRAEDHRGPLRAKDIERARGERDEPEDDRDDRRPAELGDGHPEEDPANTPPPRPQRSPKQRGPAVAGCAARGPRAGARASPRPAPSRPRATSRGARSHRVPA